MTLDLYLSPATDSFVHAACGMCLDTKFHPDDIGQSLSRPRPCPACCPNATATRSRKDAVTVRQAAPASDPQSTRMCWVCRKAPATHGNECAEHSKQSDDIEASWKRGES